MKILTHFAYALAMAVGQVGHASGPAQPNGQTLVGAIALTSVEESHSIHLEVDLMDLARYLVHVRMKIPVQEGRTTLAYPKWEPGTHSAVGEVGNLAGLHIHAGNQVISWIRDPVASSSFHLEVPGGVGELLVEFDAVYGATTNWYHFDWFKFLMYPQGAPVDSMRVQARLKIPDGWSYASALGSQVEAPGNVRFEETDLATLVDSPVCMGQYIRRFDLGAPDGIPHHLDLCSETEDGLKVDEAWLTHMKALVRESGALFGARHYQHYDYLQTIAKDLRDGLEHHQCGETGGHQEVLEPKSRKTAAYMDFAMMIPHEMVHSWDGKYRRPEGLATPDFQTPMRGDLLWVYEGLTEYLGFVLDARCGMMTPEEFRDILAVHGALELHQDGRDWRPLQDTVHDMIIDNGPKTAWKAYRRWIEDFYFEGACLWLEADGLIRERSHGKRSLDDFCRAFFGGKNTGPIVKPYDLAEVIASLNKVEPYDWTTFLDVRVKGTNPATPLSGLAQCGWKLTWSKEQNLASQWLDFLWRFKGLDTSYGLGARVDPEGVIVDLHHGSPADKAGLAPTMKVIGVNGRLWSMDGFKEALKCQRPMDLLVAQGLELKTIHVEYREGEKFPTLEAIPGATDLLSAIASPKTKAE